MKPKKCKVCANLFEPRSPLQSVCSIKCATDIAIKKRTIEGKKAIQKQNRELKTAKDKIKTRTKWIKEAQQSFNIWVRERDKDNPCISCQRYHTGQYHAGHYRTTKACPELRFEPLNVHKQCSVCNNHLSGNILEYRINLIKLGVDVDWLEGFHQPKHYTIDELKAIKAKYNKLAKDLKSVCNIA